MQFNFSPSQSFCNYTRVVISNALNELQHCSVGFWFGSTTEGVTNIGTLLVSHAWPLTSSCSCVRSDLFEDRSLQFPKVATWIGQLLATEANRAHLGHRWWWWFKWNKNTSLQKAKIHFLMRKIGILRILFRPHLLLMFAMSCFIYHPNVENNNNAILLHFISQCAHSWTTLLLMS